MYLLYMLVNVTLLVKTQQSRDDPADSGTAWQYIMHEGPEWRLFPEV